jgi:hypothetical protein
MTVWSWHLAADGSDDNGLRHVDAFHVITDLSIIRSS